jgi:hypothetical protein
MIFGCIVLIHKLVKGTSDFAEAVAIEFLNEYVETELKNENQYTSKIIKIEI